MLLVADRDMTSIIYQLSIHVSLHTSLHVGRTHALIPVPVFGWYCAHILILKNILRYHTRIPLHPSSQHTDNVCNVINSMLIMCNVIIGMSMCSTHCVAVYNASQLWLSSIVLSSIMLSVPWVGFGAQFHYTGNSVQWQMSGSLILSLFCLTFNQFNFGQQKL